MITEWKDLSKLEQSLLSQITAEWMGISEIVCTPATRDAMSNLDTTYGLVIVSILPFEAKLSAKGRALLARTALSAPQPPAETAKTGDGEAMDFEGRYEKLVYQWSDTHLAVSSALGIEFDPEGSDKRYTEAIEGLREQVTRLLGKVEALTGENKQRCGQLEVARKYIESVVAKTSRGGEWNGYNGDIILSQLSIDAEKLLASKQLKL